MTNHNGQGFSYFHQYSEIPSYHEQQTECDGKAEAVPQSKNNYIVPKDLNVMPDIYRPSLQMWESGSLLSDSDVASQASASCPQSQALPFNLASVNSRWQEVVRGLPTNNYNVQHREKGTMMQNNVITYTVKSPSRKRPSHPPPPNIGYSS